MAHPHPVYKDAALTEDIDPQETGEWLAALDSVLAADGDARAHYLLEALLDRAQTQGHNIIPSPYTPYINTIPTDQQVASPGNLDIERRIRAVLRWNAMAMVVRANRQKDGIGGHIASYASLATMYECGYNHFFHGPSDKHDGDLVFFQGHSSPGNYARSHLEGVLDDDHLDSFRAEVKNDKGLSSYPHPYLMPGYWQFSTVSMGIGPMNAIYQARFLRYLHNRGIKDTEGRHVWAFCGDGEMNEPESTGALEVASREGLDNLIFVINCNLQRLDGPVLGNGKVIQQMEGIYRGAGWNVIKVIWGSDWDALLAKDKSGKLLQLMNETVDGDYQSCKANGGAYTREHFFGKYPETAALVADMTDDEIGQLTRGGHDASKVYAAFHKAVNTKNGRPTVILAKTVKGYGMGDAGEAQNIAHQQKKIAGPAIKAFRDRFDIPVADDKVDDLPYVKLPEDSEEMQYVRARREELGGHVPFVRDDYEALEIPPLEKFKRQIQSSGEREYSTTMAFVQILQTLTRDKKLKNHLVPIVPDEARTFGMEGMFRSLGIYSPVGQLFEPEDRESLAYYREAKNGMVLQEGITESGSMSSFMAAATSYYNNGVPMIPFFAYYSMFGYQRIGDFVWAAGDMRARGFIMGGTAGRTTLAGEGLQHNDGHNTLMYDMVPNCHVYDPTFAFEMAVILHHGMNEMYVNDKDVFYYITMLNENYSHPGLPEGSEEDIIKGLYQLEKSKSKAKKKRVQLLGSGSILKQAVMKAAEMLEADWDIAADIWGAPSFSLLRRDGMSTDRWNRLHPTETPKKSFVEQQLENSDGPVIAATDYLKAYADNIRNYVPTDYYVLGTDGFGRSDTREGLRDFFEVDARWVTVTALKALADRDVIKQDVVVEAMKKYGIDPETPEPEKN